MLKPSSYAFRNDDTSILTMDSIGWQTINSSAYSFTGDNRPDCGHVIFQYTLSGQGYLDYEQQSIPLPKGTAFLVKVPSSHRYFYQNQGEPWEVIWLNLRGDEANRIWDLVIALEGPVIRRESGAPLIQGLWKLLRMVAEGKATDKYQLSVAVYEWMITLLQSSREQTKDMSPNSSTLIHTAKKFMKEHYAKPLTLDMISQYCEINKHYLCRLFQRSEQTSPLAYLRDRRVEAALALLRTTEMPIQDIGQHCGFDSPSYFGKIFRAYMNMTPKEYRLKQLEFPFDAIYYE
ncbi:AraC family transcriptional regulator [Paenibacillus sp. HWE-109]|uniref:AraC family transcriptional regulator n=1 Tax=Paenibacillus sp. HWE-109 TaxID=1306526 RepID=UPI001EDE9280|nr:AraC family transcriptional regulator [Paenibacillus sp. HWE-109]UKS29476.1 AraC family transcriptional regulator [Paenibacillus sp. HWE-109]